MSTPKNKSSVDSSIAEFFEKALQTPPVTNQPFPATTNQTLSGPVQQPTNRNAWNVSNPIAQSFKWMIHSYDTGTEPLISVENAFNDKLINEGDRVIITINRYEEKGSAGNVILTSATTTTRGVVVKICKDELIIDAFDPLSGEETSIILRPNTFADNRCVRYTVACPIGMSYPIGMPYMQSCVPEQSPMLFSGSCYDK